MSLQFQFNRCRCRLPLDSIKTALPLCSYRIESVDDDDDDDAIDNGASNKMKRGRTSTA